MLYLMLLSGGDYPRIVSAAADDAVALVMESESEGGGRIHETLPVGEHKLDLFSFSKVYQENKFLHYNFGFCPPDDGDDDKDDNYALDRAEVMKKVCVPTGHASRRLALIRKARSQEVARKIRDSQEEEVEVTPNKVTLTLTYEKLAQLIAAAIAVAIVELEPSQTKMPERTKQPRDNSSEIKPHERQTEETGMSKARRIIAEVRGMIQQGKGGEPESLAQGRKGEYKKYDGRELPLARGRDE
ncbi:hypothetical protein PHJA_000520100 [Phtheirospermum japonicum]|uniref:Uncharacterized protein n=1 Tax=Phtheirospermum japonicum TaxID=374723 RepID=A0A830B9R9_9LAMI|nr:hypothetical protein PHJA_000520100 [Phtheirospermum japonicum]